MSLVEILVAAAIITIGLVAVIQGFPIGIHAMDVGRHQSTAVFLAEQKLEQIKAWSVSTDTGQGFGTVRAGQRCFTSANPRGPCQSDALNTIAGYPTYQRIVTITNPTATTAVVRVQVDYRQTIGQGRVTIATMLAARNLRLQARELSE